MTQNNTFKWLVFVILLIYLYFNRGDLWPGGMVKKGQSQKIRQHIDHRKKIVLKKHDNHCLNIISFWFFFDATE
jgi:hypothetical protein